MAVHFKGKGFYATDYGSRKRQREAKEGEGSETSAPKDDSKSKSSEKSTESSSATKSDSASKAA